jgi:GNAT superfamily N-acetyltransferase
LRRFPGYDPPLTVVRQPAMIPLAMADTVTVRLARIDEHDVLEALQRRASLADPEIRDALADYPFELILPIAQIQAGQVFVGELNGVVAGVASVVLRHDGAVALDGLFVDPEFWRKGVGRGLVARSAQFARDAGADALSVISSFGAEPFYQSCGFATLGPFESRFVSALRMQMQL